MRPCPTGRREEVEHSGASLVVCYVRNPVGINLVTVRPDTPARTQESIDTGSPLGQAVFTIIAAIAQLDRSLIAERVRAGLRRAKADGTRLGRPRVEVDPVRFESVLRRDLSVREGARELGISASSFARLVGLRQRTPRRVTTDTTA